jgi:hypothetical protein
MDYKKLYEDAFKKTEEIYNDKDNIQYVNAEGLIEEIFPQLKESEDEKIKQYLLSLIDKIWDYAIDSVGLDKNNIIAWLKKHGEKQDYNPYKATIESIAAMVEKYANGDLRDFYDNIKVKCKDAIEYDKTWNKKQDEQKPTDSYCQDNCKGFQETGKCFADGECKAKRNAEQKSTQEVESFEAEHGKYYYCIKDYFCGGRKQASKGDVVQALRGLPIMGLKDASEYFLPVNNVQNPAWSEEDEKILGKCIDAASGYYSPEDKQSMKDWLESLKNRVQPHWKPTEEQMETLDLLHTNYVRCDDWDMANKIKLLYNDLKKL